MLKLINDNGIILCICGMLLTFQSAFLYDFSCQIIKQTWICVGTGLSLGLTQGPQEAGLIFTLESNDLPYPFLFQLWLFSFHPPNYASVFLVFLAVALEFFSLYIVLCSLAQSYYRNLINNKFQCSDRSIKCMIRRDHYGKSKMHRRVPAA